MELTIVEGKEEGLSFDEYDPGKKMVCATILDDHDRNAAIELSDERHFIFRSPKEINEFIRETDFHMFTTPIFPGAMFSALIAGTQGKLVGERKDTIALFVGTEMALRAPLVTGKELKITIEVEEVKPGRKMEGRPTKMIQLSTLIEMEGGVTVTQGKSTLMIIDLR